MRTPFYGACVMVAAMLVGLTVTYWTHPPPVVRGVVLALVVLAELVGVGMTLRDRS